MSSTPKALTPTSSEGGSPPREDAAGRQVDEPPSVVEEGTESIQPITEPQDDDDVDHVGTNEEAAAVVAPQGEEGEAGAQASSGDGAADDAETIIEDRLAAAEAAALAIEGQAEQAWRSGAHRSTSSTATAHQSTTGCCCSRSSEVRRCR